MQSYLGIDYEIRDTMLIINHKQYFNALGVHCASSFEHIKKDILCKSAEEADKLAHSLIKLAREFEGYQYHLEWLYKINDNFLVEIKITTNSYSEETKRKISNHLFRVNYNIKSFREPNIYVRKFSSKQVAQQSVKQLIQKLRKLEYDLSSNKYKQISKEFSELVQQ